MKRKGLFLVGLFVFLLAGVSATHANYLDLSQVNDFNIFIDMNISNALSFETETMYIQGLLKKIKTGELDPSLSKGAFHLYLPTEDRDIKESVGYLKKAIENKNAYACYMLGSMYYEGLVVEQNFYDAAYWIEKAANADIMIAQTLLGHMYERGKGVTRDYQEAEKWYSRAAENGDACAQNHLANIYFDGRGNIQKNVPLAINLYKKSAKQDFGESQFMLGLLYLAGMNTGLDNSEAYIWSSLASREKDSQFASTALEHKRTLAKQLSPDELKQAEKEISEWKPELNDFENEYSKKLN